MSERDKFESWLAKNPDTRYWNTTDAMFSAYLAGMKSSAIEYVYEMRRYDRFIGDVGWGEWATVSKEDYERLLSLKDEDVETRITPPLATQPQAPQGAVTRHLLSEVEAERVRQDLKWGGAAHDDSHDTSDFVQFIEDYAGWARTMACMGSYDKARRRLVQVAALAVAACESIDRAAPKTETPEGDKQ